MTPPKSNAVRWCEFVFWMAVIFAILGYGINGAMNFWGVQ